MTPSQLCMIGALVLTLIAWTVARARGHRSAALQQIFAAITVQSVAAIVMSLFQDSLPVSLAMATIILAAVAWMVWAGTRLTPPALRQ